MSDESEGDEENGGGRGRRGRSGDESDGGSGSVGGSGDEGRSARDEGPSTAEKTVIALSVALTLVLFAYAGWQMAFGPTTAAPEVTVEGTDRLANDSVAVSVRLRNPSGAGLITATVQSNCSSPSQTVQFSYVPSASTRTGTLVCPPGTTEPSVSMANWISR